MKNMDYTLIRTSRKTISIQLSPDGEVVVRAPYRMPKREIDRFVESKRDWIEGHLAKLPETQAYALFMSNYLDMVEFVKVAGHTGVEGNELADKLAKAALE